VKIEGVQLTTPLEAWIASCGTQPLLVRQEGEDILVLRQDGSEPRMFEHVRIHGILAAHAAEPFTRGPSPRKRRRGGRPVYTPETAARRARGGVKILLRPEEAGEWRAWAAEHGGIAAHARWLLRARKKV
jgi:hypothetical protein